MQYDPSNVTALRAETAAVCDSLEEQIAALESSTLSPDAVEETYKSQIQPRAHGLAEAMLCYVSDGDPRIMTDLRVGDVRILRSDALNTIELPFDRRRAAAQLDTVLNQLRTLTGHLPH